MPTSLLLCVFMKSSTEHTHHQLTDYVGDPSSTACGGIRVEKLCWDDGKDCRQGIQQERGGGVKKTTFSLIQRVEAGRMCLCM